MQTPHSIRHKLEQASTAIADGRLGEASEILKSLTPERLEEKRMKAHFEAILLFHRGRIVEAQKRMQEALEGFGSNVNLLRDLVACQYHARDMIGFRSNMNALELLLIEKESQLNASSLIECEAMLGKFLEEEARLAPAILFYERALGRATRPEQRTRILMQKARWIALYEPNHELGNFYRELISIPADQTFTDLRIELQHCLMLIELRLVGVDHAWQRIERLGLDVHNMDRRLLIFDFIEGCLSQDLELHDRALKIVDEFDNLDPYEDFLRKVIKEPRERLNQIRELESLAAQLSWSSYLRLLCLTANRETQESVRTELQRKIQLILQGLDGRSQNLWNQRLKQALQAPEIRIELSNRARKITVQGKSVDLSKKKIALQLLGGLLSDPKLSVDRAIELLWASSFTPEHYHRLRMSTHRLNTLVHEVTGLGKIIEVDSESVSLRPEVRMRCVDESLDRDWPSL